MDYGEKIQMILEWADDDDRGGFDGGFVVSLEDALNEHGSLTMAQEVAGDNIIEKFHINP